MNDTIYIENTESLWQKRGEMTPLPLWFQLVLLAGVTLLSGLFSVTPLMPLALALSSAGFALLLVQCRRFYIWVALPAAFFLCFLANGVGFLPSLISLAFVPCALILSVCLFLRKKCSPTVLWVTLFLVVATLAAFAGFLKMNYGDIIGGAKTLWNEIAETGRETIQKTFDTTGLPPSLSELYTEYYESITETIDLTPYFLPGMLLILSASTAWLSCKVLFRLLKRSGGKDFFFEKNWNVMVPAWWAYAYVIVTLASLIIAFLPESEERRLSVMAANLIVLLEAPLFVIGCRRVRILLRKFRRNGIMLPYYGTVILGVLLAICQPRLVLLGLAFIGTMYIIRRYKRKKMSGTFPPQDFSDEDMNGKGE